MKKIGLAILILIVLILFISLIGYLYSYWMNKPLHQIKLTEWQQLSSLVYGASGIILGYLYFKSKIDIDSDIAKKDRRRSRVTFIRDELILIDKLIEKIWHDSTDNPDNHNKIKYEIDKRFTMLSNNYLEKNDKIIGFSNKELQIILAVHSFVEGKNLLCKDEIDQTKKSSYLAVFLEATQMCLQKIEDI